MLNYPDQSKRFFLDTDASDHTIGAVLSQNDHHQLIRPVAFYSRKLSDAELNYSVYDKELLAIIESLTYWRHYLISPVEPTQIRTDHKNLLYFRTPQLLKPRHARLMELLQQFPFKIEHIKGAHNSVADALSRANFGPDLPNLKDNQLLVLPDDKWTLNSINAIKTRSDWPTMIKGFLETDKWDKNLDEEDLKFLNGQLKNFILKDDKLYFDDDKQLKLYIPSTDERQTVLKRYHEYLGHLASKSILPLIDRHFYWPTLERDLKDFVASCPRCQLNKSSPRSISNSLKEPLKPVPPVALPFERWGLDFIQNLPTTKKGNKHIITAIDYATRWIVAKPVERMDTNTVIKFLYESILVNYGSPL